MADRTINVSITIDDESIEALKKSFVEWDISVDDEFTFETAFESWVQGEIELALMNLHR